MRNIIIFHYKALRSLHQLDPFPFPLNSHIMSLWCRCPLGLKREAGAIPARSRHCDGEFSPSRHWENREGGENDEPQSGDLPAPDSGLALDGEGVRMAREHLFVFGVSDRFPPALQEYSLVALHEAVARAFQERLCSGFVTLRTCQRFEIYGTALQKPFLQTFDCKEVFILENQDVVRRLFRIATGLESALFGEVHILGQVRRAWERAWQEKHTNKVLNLLFQTALHVGKKLRAYLPGEYAFQSFGSLVATVLEKELTSLRGKSVALFGWGMLGRSVAGALLARGVQTIFVSTRHREHVPQNPSFVPIEEEEKPEVLSQVHALVCAANTRRYAVTRDMLKPCGLPHVLVDLAVPRNIDPEVVHLGKRVYFLEELLCLAREQTLPFPEKLSLLETLVEEEVTRFMRKLKGLDADPLIQTVLDDLRRIFTEGNALLRDTEVCAPYLEYLREKAARKTVESIRRFFEEQCSMLFELEREEVLLPSDKLKKS